MKLIKLKEDHYIIVDDSYIKEGDWFLNTVQRNIYCNNILNYDVNKDYLKKITHSTQPLGFLEEEGITTSNLKQTYGSAQPLSLSEVKELLGEVDVEKKSENLAKSLYDKSKHEDWDIYNSLVQEDAEMIKLGYNQALEDNKEKKYTEKDMKKMFIHGKQLGLTIAGAIRNGGDKPDEKEWFSESLQSKTEWEVEFDEQGNLKLI